MKFLFDYSLDTGFMTPERRVVLESAAGVFVPVSAPSLPVQVYGLSTLANAAQGAPAPNAKIRFRSTMNWVLEPDKANPDFYTACLHELCHVIGFGTTAPWFADVKDGKFNGPFASRLNQGPVDLSPDHSHWTEAERSEGKETAMDPSFGPGRKELTRLDWAGLLDLGYDDRMTKFLKRLYLTFLGREADPDGLTWWWATYGTKSPEVVAATFLTSPELIKRATLIYQ